MKHTLVPSLGTGWVWASINSMRNWLFRSLLNRFIPAVYHDPFRSSFGVPARSVLLSIDPHRSCPFSITCFQCRSGYDDFFVADHQLTAIPFWQFN